MKKNVFVVFVIIVVSLSGCIQSRKDKAESFAKEMVPKVLNDASSYEPVDTKVDSAFESIYIDGDAVEAAYKLIDLNSKKENLLDEYNQSRSSAEMYVNPYMTNFDREEIHQEKEYQNKLSKQLEKVNSEIKEQKNIIYERNKKIKKEKFCGWAISHRFRCASNNGIKSLHFLLIVADEKIENTKCILNMDENDADSYEKVQETIDDVIAK